ncbi:hypothetical protein DRP04_07465 [Archaeoglobales archaeon]|nr:MAG: hypothetical protein DRP04_07465 [Archaeoglobales archaeon]
MENRKELYKKYWKTSARSLDGVSKKLLERIFYHWKCWLDLDPELECFVDIASNSLSPFWGVAFDQPVPHRLYIFRSLEFIFSHLSS